MLNKLPDNVQILLLFLMMVPCLKSHAQHASDISGEWQLPDDKGKITIAANRQVFEGKLNTATVGKKGGFHIRLPTGWLGIYILRDIVYEKPNHWHGLIYNPDDKKMYTCNLELQENGELKIRAYKGISLLGKTIMLKRITE